jgi:hypothetical protein
VLPLCRGSKTGKRTSSTRAASALMWSGHSLRQAQGKLCPLPLTLILTLISILQSTHGPLRHRGRAALQRRVKGSCCENGFSRRSTVQPPVILSEACVFALRIRTRSRRIPALVTFNPARVERTLLSAAFDLDLDSAARGTIFAAAWKSGA